MRKLITATSVAIALALGGLGLVAAGAATSPSSVIHGCVKLAGRSIVDVYTAQTPKCPKATTFPIQWNAQGPAGPENVTPPHVTKDFDPISSVPTGGGFLANSTEVGTLDLGPGTYLIGLNAKVTPPSGGTGSAQVFPQFFVYNQAKNASFTGDLFNVGSGPIESGANATIDSYYSGSQVVTLASATTLRVYAFGYDSDQGAGSYQLDDLTVTAVPTS